MGTALSQIIPDFVVEAVDNGELILSMNNRGIPRHAHQP